MDASSAAHAALWGGSAWTAERSDYSQALIVDLGTIKNVTGIATQGRAHTKEFVVEYRIQYGANGRDWIDYKEIDGSPKLFQGNEDGDYVVRNDFDQPIIAQWIRINPTRLLTLKFVLVNTFRECRISDGRIESRSVWSSTAAPTSLTCYTLAASQ